MSILRVLLEIYIFNTPRFIGVFLVLQFGRIFFRRDVAPGEQMSQTAIGVLNIMAWPWYALFVFRGLLYRLTEHWHWMWNTNMYPANRWPPRKGSP